MELEEKMRIVQELVPGKQISLAHIIANPDESFYTAAGLENKGGAIGIVNTSPAEFALIAGDIGVKASGVKIAHIDYHDSGTLILTGEVSQMQSALSAISDYCRSKLDFSVCEITKT
ncbi:MAG: BMC domain-containing protein [Clostridia bacterium]|nr:BMC domain-containing protein [Clostridia bacterium]